VAEVEAGFEVVTEAVVVRVVAEEVSAVEEDGADAIADDGNGCHLKHRATTAVAAVT
jgi:hypothetical protein